jgi:branched-chain amino acid transport system substrate-binding protein
MMNAIAARVNRTLLAGMMGCFALGLSGAGAQTSIDIGLMGPFSGPWAEHGKFMRIGAEMAVEEINRQGGIKSLGGAKINLVVADTGPSVETATNAAQLLLLEFLLPCCE